ncbi:MAG: S9 family peptidase [Cyclobacteriaceae bacterium]|nr:S9 family peptidase [Cyclobacteriaceae bacterium]
MKSAVLVVISLCLAITLPAQNTMTPELLWKLGRVSAQGVTKDGKSVIYSVRTYDMASNSSVSRQYIIPVAGGQPVEIQNGASLLQDKHLSPTGDYRIAPKEVKVKSIFGADHYQDLQKSDAMIYDDLMYRHWDKWEDGKFSHLFLYKGLEANGKDLMEGEPYNCPQSPFGGEEDYTWSPDGKTVVYVAKKKYGKDYALSTNTDLYAYEILAGKTTNLTQGMMGYDTNPAFSAQGVLGWLSMKSDGYEADKNDIMVMTGDAKINLTASWDGTVESFLWKADGTGIYFNAAVDGTIQLFEVDYPGKTKKMPVVQQITKGDFDVKSLVGLVGTTMIISRTDMNHADELYSVSLTNGSMTQLTHVNDEVYKSIALSKVERRYVTTTDNKKMLVWVIYPPDFDPAKKYPTLLYCQGGPQSPLSQFYSFRWNFQVMSSQGYIVVAPNRRGMPGHGVEWNAAISKDYGGQPMRDYLSAIDDVAKEKFVDTDRLGCIGASFGGYSVFYLAGNHDKRFKSFIAHDGIFNMASMYGTTEELFFNNWDNGGAYWEKDNAAAMKAYNEFNPMNYVNNWDTPILIIQGGKDYRVPDGQAMEAFQAAQMKGLKSRFLYFPQENHWVLQAQNGLVWQREFFRWLKETL